MVGKFVFNGYNQSIFIMAAAAEVHRELDLKCKLIEEMRSHLHIYDMAHKDHSNKHKKDQSYHEIGAIIGMPGGFKKQCMCTIQNRIYSTVK